jgi:hypothetical protein
MLSTVLQFEFIKLVGLGSPYVCYFLSLRYRIHGSLLRCIHGVPFGKQEFVLQGRK